MPAHTLVVVAAVSGALCSGVGFAAATLSQPDNAGARRADPSAKLLKDIKLNTDQSADHLAQIEATLGQRPATELTAHGLLDAIQKSSKETCESVSSTPYIC